MKKLLLVVAIVGCIVTQPFYAQPKNDLITYQKQYMKHATSTKDTILLSAWEYCKFSIAPLETDSVLYFSFSNFGATDSARIVTPQVWNQPDWIDTYIYPRLVIKGATDYILIIYGRKRP